MSQLDEPDGQSCSHLPAVGAAVLRHDARQDGCTHSRGLQLLGVVGRLS